MLRRGIPASTSAAKKLVDATTRRTLMLQENQGINLLRENGIAVPPFGVAKTADEAAKVCREIGGQDFVIKAQVLAGGRGKGKFDSGLQGGVQVVVSPEEAKNKAGKMIGHYLITKQATDKGAICKAVVVAKRMYPRREYYFSITLDRKFGGPVMIGSSKGGVNIEEVAKEDPSAIITIPVDIQTGLKKEDALKMVKELGITDACVDKATDIIQKLYAVFIKSDANMLEINPLFEDVNGTVYCMDCKVIVDDYRLSSKGLVRVGRKLQVDEMELRAAKANLNYIRLSGNIGCMVNGAGLAMFQVREYRVSKVRYETSPNTNATTETGYSGRGDLIARHIAQTHEEAFLRTIQAIENLKKEMERSNGTLEKNMERSIGTLEKNTEKLSKNIKRVVTWPINVVAAGFAAFIMFKLKESWEALVKFWEGLNRKSGFIDDKVMTTTTNGGGAGGTSTDQATTTTTNGGGAGGASTDQAL